MRIGIGFILARAKTTRHAQEDLKPSWMWNEKTLEQWDIEIAGLQRMQEAFSTAEFNRNSTRAALDAGLQDFRAVGVFLRGGKRARRIGVMSAIVA